MNDLHLLIVTGFWPVKKNTISGVFVPQQIDALAHKLAQLTVVVPYTRWRTHGGCCSLAEVGLNHDNIHLLEVPTWRLPEKLSGLPGGIRMNTFFNRIALTKAIRQIAGERSIDGCIIHGMRYAGFGLPSWRKYISGRSMLVLHGVDPFLTKSNVTGKINSIIAQVNEAVDSFVLVGSPLRPHALKLGLKENKLHIIGNGTPIPLLSELSQRRHNPANCVKILSVANLVPLKGIDDNLRALAEIADYRPDLDWHYRIVGDGPFRAELERMTDALGISHRVTFLGRLPYADTMQEMSECDIFSLPSWGEAFGIVYLEAMARFKPVIGCYANGADDIVTDGKDGLLIPPHDVAALTQALEKLIEKPDWCHSMGRESRKTAENFSWEQNARRVLMLIDLEQSKS